MKARNYLAACLQVSGMLLAAVGLLITVFTLVTFLYGRSRVLG
jgi:hypothetical protein